MLKMKLMGLLAASVAVGSASSANAGAAKLSLVGAQATADQGAPQVVPDECAKGAKTFVGADGQVYSCKTLKPAKAGVKKGPGLFGYTVIGLAASGGAAAAAQNSNGRPASP